MAHSPRNENVEPASRQIWSTSAGEIGEAVLRVLWGRGWRIERRQIAGSAQFDMMSPSGVWRRGLSPIDVVLVLASLVADHTASQGDQRSALVPIIGDAVDLCQRRVDR